MTNKFAFSLIAAGLVSALGISAYQKISEGYSEPPPATTEVVEVPSSYIVATDECVAKDGSGSFVNFTKDPILSDYQCDTIFSNYNIQKYAGEKEAKYPGALVASDKYDMAILHQKVDEERKREYAASQQRLEDWAVRSYEAEQKHQDKCWDQMQTRGYGDANCYR